MANHSMPPTSQIHSARIRLIPRLCHGGLLPLELLTIASRFRPCRRRWSPAPPSLTRALSGSGSEADLIEIVEVALAVRHDELAVEMERTPLRTAVLVVVHHAADADLPHDRASGPRVAEVLDRVGLVEIDRIDLGLVLDPDRGPSPRRPVRSTCATAPPPGGARSSGSTSPTVRKAARRNQTSDFRFAAADTVDRLGHHHRAEAHRGQEHLVGVVVAKRGGDLVR